MRRPILLLATSLILGLAAATLLGLASLARPLSFAAARVADEAVVHRFYEAVNTALATGDPALLQAIVAPDLVAHGPVLRTGAGLAGLVEYVLALRATSPELRLTVEAVVAAGDRAIARVTASGASSLRFLGDPLLDQPANWGPVDVFRVAGRQVVEHWGSTDGAIFVWPGDEVTDEVAATVVRALAVERRTFAPGAYVRWDADAGPLLLHVETGKVLVRPDVAEDAVRLWADESLALPGGRRYEIRNDGREPAQVLVAAVVAPPPLSGDPAIDDRTFRPDPTPPGVTIEQVDAGSAVPIPAGTILVALGRATLAPGGRLTLPTVTGSVAILVRSGALRFECSNVGWVRRGADGMVRTETGTVLTGGDSAHVGPGNTVTVSNTGEEPAEVLVMALRPPPSSPRV